MRTPERTSAMLGIAGEAAWRGSPPPPAGCGIAGLDTSGRAACGLTGEAPPNLLLPGALLDPARGAPAQRSARLGDRAAHTAWTHGFYFADFSYLVAPCPDGGVRWRAGLEARLGAAHRPLPLYLDAAGFRREISGTAPRWAHRFEYYPAAIELLQPDGYAAWDYPQDRSRSLAALRELMAIFPDDVRNGRMWPVFSIHWSYDPAALATFQRLPHWAGRSLAGLIPHTRTQRPLREDEREILARQAIAQALTLAADPDLRWMVETFGRVMIGGLVRGPIPRLARHLLAGALVQIYQGFPVWLLGQSSAAVINGLGCLDLLSQVWSDGSWWLHQARCETLSYVENGLITVLPIGGGHRRKQARAQGGETFFTLHELMAANLRSLLAAYAGQWIWPAPAPLPVDPDDPDQMAELHRRVHAVQLEFDL